MNEALVGSRPWCEELLEAPLDRGMLPTLKPLEDKGVVAREV